MGSSTKEVGYLAADGYVTQLAEELPSVTMRYDRLLIGPELACPPAWALNVWEEPEYIQMASIGDGARALRAMQRNWVQYSEIGTGRSRLLEEKLPHVSCKPLTFPSPKPSAALGSWTLLDRNTLLASAACSSAFPNGEAQFVVDQEGPPNRAYLKLWEALTLCGQMPTAGQTCLDLGSSPGGWTWVLAELGARVISVDRAKLDPRIEQRDLVEFRQESAFGLEPTAIGPVDWLFSDIVCYPTRLLTLIRRWLDSGLCKRFICTIKFQGDTDFAIAEEFASIPGSRLQHLFSNKHELTFFLVPEEPDLTKETE